MNFIATWLPVFPSFLLAIVALFVPGLLWGLAFRLRGALLAAATVPLSAALITTSAVVAQLIGFWWGWLFLAGYTAVVVAATWSIIFWWRRKHPAAPVSASPRWLLPEVLIGTLLTAAASGIGTLRAFGTPDTPSQTWDATYHLAAARLMFATGNASTLYTARVSNLDDPAIRFYPGGWHELVTLVMEHTGNAVIASNITVLAVITVLWPVAAALFAHFLFPETRFVPLAAALLAGASTAFPERPSSYGALWPMVLSYAMVPLALAVAVYFFRGPVFRPNWKVLSVLFCGLIGVGITHPQGVLAFVVIGSPLLIAKGISLLRRPNSATRAGKVFLGIALPGLIAALLVVSKSSIGQMPQGYTDRPPFGSALGELRGVIIDGQLTQQGYGIGSGWWLFGVLLFLGMIGALVMRQQRWLIGSWVLAAYLFVVSAAITLPGYFLVGLWYYDAVRLGAIVPLVAVPIMALGVAWPLNALVSGVVKKWNLPIARIRLVASAVLIVVVVALTGILGKTVGSRQLWINYRSMDETGLNGLVSEPELEMIGRASEELPPGSKVLGSPFSGAPLVFDVAGVDVVFMVYAQPESEDLAYLGEHFADINSDPRICQILGDRGIQYFYYDPVLYRVGDGKQAPWFNSLENPGDAIDHFKVIDHGGTATLYQITSCD